MSAYWGKFQYLDEGGAELSQGLCQLRFDAETLILTPASGPPLAFDLGDLERLAARDWELDLTLWTGRRIGLRQFGAVFSTMREELLEAWRNRTVRCLLLEDLEEIARYDGTAALGGPAAPAQIRLYGSNLAVLPLDGPARQWRLAELDAVSFDAYALTLESSGERLAIARLGKKTEEFRGNLEGALEALKVRQAETLHAVFPFLSPGQFERLARAMPEGRSVSLAALGAIHAKLPDALIARVVDEPLRPYFEALRARAAGDSLMTGFKFVRPDEEEPDPDPETPETEGKEEKQPVIFWFFFPLPGGRTAWEATTGSGRATYFFDAPAPVDQAIARLTHGLALINFRREPIYLPDESLEREQRYRRYAIGCRKLPDLRFLRSAFRGRAIHTTVEAWTAQVETAASRAG